MHRFLLLFSFFIAGKQIRAQDTLVKDSTLILQEVIIFHHAEKITPISFHDINSRDLKIKSTGQEPSYLLAETPSITNYSDAGNSQGYSYFRIRGIDQTRINVTLDGVPLNEPEDQGAYFSNYPDILNSVSKIQIQRGVGTTKNGVASFGGSIQLFSPNIYDSTKTTIGLSYGSFNSFRAFGEYVSGFNKGKSLYVRLSQVYSDGYKYNSSNNSQSVFLSSSQAYKKSVWKINFLGGHQKNELAWLGVTDSLIEIDRKTNANNNERDEFVQFLTQINHSWQHGGFSTLQSSLYHTFLKGNYDFNLNNFLGLPNTNELFNYAFQSNMLGFISNYNYSKNKINWSIGIHGNVYNRNHIGSEKTIGKLYENIGFKNEFSAFTKIDASIQSLTIFGDIQFRYASFDYLGSVAFQKMQWHFINPKSGVSFELKPNAIIYYSIGSTGREPTRNDIFGGNDDLLADSLGNASIANKIPEYVLNQELGFRMERPSLELNLNLFYMNFKNEIVLDGKLGPNGLALTNNVEQSIRAGIEFSISYRLNDKITISNNSSYNYSRIKEHSLTFNPILTPPIIINQEIIYSLKNFSIAISMRYQDKSFMDFSNSAKLNSYILINSRLRYTINGFDFSVFINNITNTKYYNNGYIDFDGSKKYFVQSPVNLNLSLKYSF